MFEVVFLFVLHQKVTDRALLERRKRVLFAPHDIGVIDLLGGSTVVRPEPYIALVLHEVDQICRIPLDVLAVISCPQALRKLKPVRNQPLQTLEHPEEDTLGFGLHAVCNIGVIQTF